MRRLGILGGSFDPIHRGHMHMAVSARRFFDLDEVWLIPTGHSPNKDEADMTPAEHRFRMCELAAEHAEGITASRMEIDAPERSYTYRTVERLHEQFSDTKLYCIMGGDSLDYFDRWVKPQRICELATIAAVPRDVFDTDALEKQIKKIKALFPCEIFIVPCGLVPLSSTFLRGQLKNGMANPKDFPPGVYDYIRANGLYCR